MYGVLIDNILRHDGRDRENTQTGDNKQHSYFTRRK